MMKITKRISYLLTALSMIGMVGCHQQKEKKRKIVFIMTDTQRYDMLGCVNPDMKTPHLDNLAAEGMRFHHAYSTSPVCTPARSAIFTGTYPHSNGAWGNNMGMGDNIKTIGQRLSDNGMTCGYVGKWHLDGYDYFGNGVCPPGWEEDYWYDMRCYLMELSDEDKVRSRLPNTNTESIEREFTYAHRVTNRAMEFLNDKKSDDFFLVASYDEPHHPYLCPEPYASMYKDYVWHKNASHYDDLKAKPGYQVQWAEGRQLLNKDSLTITHPYFFGCNTFVDDEIGRLLDHVKKVAPDALIIYTSDHGDFLQAHSLKGKGPCVYDDVARIPFIVKWPDRIASNSINTQPVSHINIVPTILEVAGIPIDDAIEGVSLMPTLVNKDEKVQEEVFMEYGRFEVNHDGFGALQPLRAVFDGRYKLSINLMSEDELYDMQADPFEVNNLIHSAAHQKIVHQLHGKILAWMNQTRDPFRGTYWEERDWNKSFEPTWEYTHTTRSARDNGYLPRVRDYNNGLEVNQYDRQKELDKKK